MTDGGKTTTEMLVDLGARAEAALAAIDGFQAIVEAYLTLTGTPATQFGKASGGGIDFVRHMREPRDLRRSTICRVLRHISDSGKAVEMLA